MKRFLLSLTVLFAAQFTNAVEPITQFSCSAFDEINSTFTIEATPIDKNGAYSLDIPMLTFRGNEDTLYLRISSNKIPQFVAELQEAKEIYARWKSKAKGNDITNMKAKKMDIEPATYEARFLYGSWHFSKKNKPIYFFRINEVGYLFVIAILDIQSSDNPRIKNNGGSLWFSSVQEIDSFIKCLDPKLVEDHYAKKKDVGYLFD